MEWREQRHHLYHVRDNKFYYLKSTFKKNHRSLRVHSNSSNRYSIILH